tara:strand:- start:277 stop:1545 length:1269 start_codon:yes stop_codon:yes gene_type:complete
MLKAVINEEVEDVLSSIRRLVSEDKRPLAELRSAPVAAPDLEEAAAEEDAVIQEKMAAETEQDEVSEDIGVIKHEAERFILTPQLRVQTPEPENLVADNEGPLDLGLVARETWLQDANENAAEDGDTSKENEPTVSFPQTKAPDQDAAMDALDALVHDAIENEVKAIEDSLDEGNSADEGDYADEEFWDDVEDDGSSGSVDTPDTPNQEQSDVAHRFEGDDHVENGANWELHEDAQTEHAAEQDEAFEDEHVEELASIEEAPFFEDVPTEEEQFDDEPNEKRTPYIPLTAKIAALEAVIGGRNQDYEPGGDETEDLSTPDTAAMAWEDDVELDARGEPFVASVQAAQEAKTAHQAEPDMEERSAAASFTADDQVMDEEALRDLVSEIVRSELQGALGERITRNVRKLVRREIHRALTAQEME